MTCPPRVALYLDNDSSEVSGEWDTLHAAIATKPAKDGHLISNGAPLAFDSHGWWVLTDAGRQRLMIEHAAAKDVGKEFCRAS